MKKEDLPMAFRHEWKHIISLSDMVILQGRLPAIMHPDPHAIDGKYEIRSLYFDDPTDKALREKLDGVNRREKFRIRYYNGDTSLIHLEKKSKTDGLCSKLSTVLQKEGAQAIVDGDYTWMRRNTDPLITEFYSKLLSQQLRPKTIVDYTRKPYLFPAGNVRVTIDYNIRTGLQCTDLLNPECVTVPAGSAPIILEIKWDAYLPDIVRDALQLGGRSVCAFSKYAACRIYG